MNRIKENIRLLEESNHVFDEELSLDEEYYLLKSHKVVMDNLSLIENAIRGLYQQPYGCMTYYKGAEDFYHNEEMNRCWLLIKREIREMERMIKMGVNSKEWNL